MPQFEPPHRTGAEVACDMKTAGFKISETGSKRVPGKTYCLHHRSTRRFVGEDDLHVAKNPLPPRGGPACFKRLLQAGGRKPKKLQADFRQNST